ncbi:MAG: hypothetical protein J6P19_02840 [Acetobacter sp.]|nr:hypothetical protein [Acetobacter sp.]
MKSSEQKAILQLMKKSSSQTEQDVCSDFDQYVLEKASKHNQSWMQIVPFENVIKKQLKRGFTKKTIYSYLIDKNLINCTYQVFTKFILNLDKKSDLIKDKEKTISIPKTQQTIREDTATQIKETQKPEEIETAVEAKASQSQPQQEQKTTQTVEPEKSETLQRVIEHRQKVQAQRATEATTETKPEQQTGQTGEKTHAEKVEDYFSMMMSDTEVYPNLDAEFDVYMAKFYANNPREGRKFGDIPEGKTLTDLPQELQDTIKQEKAILREEQRIINKALNRKSNQKMREETEKNKFHHDPEAKPPGYWTGGQLTGS